MAIQIEVDARALEEALETLTPARAGQAIARALNDTAKIDIARNLLRLFSREIGLSQAKLRRTISIRRVSAAAVAQARGSRGGFVLGANARASAQVTAAGADISSAAFRPRQLKRLGASYGSRPRQRIPAGFIPTLRGGHRAVFVRATDQDDVRQSEVEGVRRTRRVRQTGADSPIAKLVVPGVSSIMIDDDTQDRIQREGSAQLAKRLVDSVRFELLRAAGRIRRPTRGR